ncbi:MAG: hypothetical protein JXA54_13475 [Candidatus Heimdallarchaeota archaeon]|nr:hypothetical protein [Candidatus Heimdallarchaeota archaeon]
MKGEELNATGGLPPTLEELLVVYEELVRNTKTEELPEELYTIVRELEEKEAITVSLLVKQLLERFIDSGEVEVYGRKELAVLLPWKKTRLSERLQKLVAEGILLHNKRKYSLNMDEPFVLRVKNALRWEVKEVNLLEVLEEYARDEKEESGMAEEEKEPFYRQLTRQEYRGFIREIFQLAVPNDYELPEDELLECLERFLENNILKVVGLTVEDKSKER